MDKNCISLDLENICKLPASLKWSVLWVIFVPTLVMPINVPCIPKTSLVSQFKQTNARNNELEIHSVLHTTLRRGEKSCFELEVISDDDEIDDDPFPIENGGKKKILEIQLTDVWQEYKVTREYNFTFPQLHVGCTCDCPGGADLCNGGHEFSHECPETFANRYASCFRQYTHGHLSRNCAVATATAELCCTAAIYNTTTDLYRAIYIESPITYYNVDFTFKDENGNLLSPPIHYKNVTTLMQLWKDENNSSLLSIDLSGQAVGNLLQWTWVYIDPKTSKVMGNVLINDVNEVNLQKLGWYKFDRDGQVVTVKPQVAKKALDVQVLNCKIDRVNWGFNAIGMSNLKGGNSTFGQPLEDFYADTLRKIVYDNRAVKVYPKATSAIVIDATLDFPFELIVRDEKAGFTDFNAVMLVDQFSNRFLNLTISDAYGILQVAIGDTDDTLSIAVVVPATEPIRFFHTIRLPSWVIGEQRVCLLVPNNDSIVSCKNVSYVEKYSTGPIIRNLDYRTERNRGEINKDYVKSWFSGVWDSVVKFTKGMKSWVHALLLGGIALVSLIILFVLCSFNACICCCSTRRKRADFV